MNYFIAALLALLSTLVLYILLVRNASSKSNLKNKKSLKVSFIHPDLGIGGAEKLVVEVALTLQRRGHQVQIYTAFHDSSEDRCFQATRDGTLKVHVHGDFLPRHIFGKFHLPCALLRFVFLSLRWLYDNWRNPQDVVFVDQISATVPLLRVSGAKVVFYCHFPDQLLTQRKSLLKKLYRLPLDLLEEITTAQADQILVNSRFTAGVFKDTFRRIKIVPAVLYPAVDHSNFIESDPKIRLKAPFFLSLNRFEGKKGHDLAVKALNIVRNEGHANIKLVIAGGFDKRLQDNRDTLAGLEKLVTEFKLENNVEFKPSVPDAERNTLLTTCMAVLYTPINEHFGIVPLEAALSGAPVIACNSGGPLETVKDSNTGYLCPPEPEHFASAMMSLLDEPQLVAEMGRNGRRHVLDNFSVQLFGDNLERLLKE